MGSNNVDHCRGENLDNMTDLLNEQYPLECVFRLTEHLSGGNQINEKGAAEIRRADR